MASYNILSNASTDGAGTGVQVTGPCSVFFKGTFDGAEVELEASDDDATYCRIDKQNFPLIISVHRENGVVHVPLVGTYYLRGVVRKSGSSTSISIVAIQ